MFEIKQENERFFIEDENKKLVGDITYYLNKEGIIVANHTYVNPEYRGQKIAQKLLDRLVEFARSKETQINPVCSYVSKTFEQNSIYQDVWKK